eukprot:5672356-Pleurochrysis_carterae.AAC.1
MVSSRPRRRVDRDLFARSPICAVEERPSDGDLRPGDVEEASRGGLCVCHAELDVARTLVAGGHAHRVLHGGGEACNARLHSFSYARTKVDKRSRFVVA